LWPSELCLKESQNNSMSKINETYRRRNIWSYFFEKYNKKWMIFLGFYWLRFE